MVLRDNEPDDPGQRNAPASRTEEIAVFGSFSLSTRKRVLQKDGVPLKIGSRALDILLTLVEHAPEVVEKRKLITRVWGPVVVEEGSLRFHVATLRKALGEERSGARFVKNIPGRGYCLATPVTWTVAPPPPSDGVVERMVSSLPRRPLRMVGRHDTLRDLTRRLREQRFVSIVGAGGIGKTTVALAIAHEVVSEFGGAVHFLDLGAIQNPQLVPGALASLLGVSVVSETPLPAVLAFLRERRALLVLDSCEHVIETVAALAENIFRDSPQVHILATSRESLRAEGERVYHLQPLEYPPQDAGPLTSAQALMFPAVQLFVDQAAAGGYPFELNNADAPIVAEVCRQLDGIALALELAASRVAAHGVQATASLLNDQFRLLWRGRRTALPRHQTLSATLDWSYNLLSEAERRTLRRLAVFVGAFSLETAQHVVGENLDSAEVTETLATLVEKSLVTLGATATMRYRLLDTTRAYARRKLLDSGEQMRIARRHTEFISDRIERLQPTVSAPSTPEAKNFFDEHLGNVRAALEWCFSEQGDIVIGARLAAVSAPFFFRLALLAECIAWTGRALSGLDTHKRETRLESELQTCLGLALMNTKGNVSEARSALTRALALADRLEDAPSQLLLLHALYRFEMRSGDLRGLMELTTRLEAASKQIDDPVAEGLAHGVRACTCSLLGNHSEVPTHARIALNHPVHSLRLNAPLFGYTHCIGARNVLARSLWMLGYPDQAVAVAGQCLTEAAGLGDPPTFVYALAWNVFVYLRVGDWQTTDQIIARLINHVTKTSMSTYHPVALGCQGSLAVLRGEPSRGIELLQTALAAMRTDGYELYRGVFGGVLAEGFAKSGQAELAYTAICDAVNWADANAASGDLPELLRIKAEILILLCRSDTNEAEACLANSLQLARQQSALSLELRTAMSLARFWADSGRGNEALALLDPIHSRFSEGLHTYDLVAASKLLVELRQIPTPS
jgi:predicted ATPase/DNA-binding winged helix-turn-helix (wHTH) protein